MTTTKLGRYWHTLRHLKPVQFYGRLWFRLYRPPANTSALAPPMRLARGSWQLPAARAPLILGPCQFKFLNLNHRLPAQGGWEDAARGIRLCLNAGCWKTHHPVATAGSPTPHHCASSTGSSGWRPVTQRQPAWSKAWQRRRAGSSSVWNGT